MELESTYSSYKRYKTNTDAVATWLLTTAKKHGCRAYDTSDSSPAASAAAPRLKGKARKLAKEADAAAAKQAALKPAAYRIEIKDFIQLAQFIAKSTTPQIKVPDHTARDLQQAIKMRKSHQAWLTMISSQTETATAADPTAADQAHTYFIHTLEIVMDILRPNMPEQFRPKPAAGNDADAKGSQLANIFEHLTVEELSEADESVADTRREEAVEKINVIVTDAVEDERSESFIASIYLSRDVHELLNDIQEVWTSYQQGQTSLMAAAITTNTAIEFCRKLQEDYEAAFSQGEKRHERCCLYCIYLEATNGEKRDSRYQSGGCLAPARQVLRSFVGAIERVGPRQAVGASAGHLSLYTRGSDDSAVSDGEKLDQEIDLALGILPEFLALIRATPPVQAEHELFRGLRQLREEKKQPFWLDFAFQVYLDMRHILCEGVDQGFRDMCRETQLIKSSVDRALDFHHEMGVQEPTSGLLRQLSDRITELVERDFVSTIVDMSRFPKDPRTAQHLPPNYHLERDPLWCGLLLYNFKIKAHEGAIFTANSCGFVLATAHLYNSLRATGTLRCEWPDMERIFAMHGVKNLFVGDLPVTFSSSVKSFGLAIGMPSFKSSICEGVGRGALGPGDIREFIRPKVTENAGFQADFDSTTDAEIIPLLPLAIEVEVPEVAFDHYHMHMVCWKLLRELRATLGECSPGSSQAPRSDMNLSGFVLGVLIACSDGEQLTSRQRATAAGRARQSASTSVSSKAAELFEVLIAREGDVASKNVRDSVSPV